ncbi:MAG: ECF transporter S component [Oscillospiraceae bacterium]
MEKLGTTTLGAKKFDTKKLVLLAVLAAIAYLVVFVFRIPVVAFLKYEPKDVIITIAGFIFGPLSSIMISFVVSLVEMVTISETGPIGAIMNFISTVAFAGTAAFIYKKAHTMKGAVIGLLTGTVVMTVLMLLWNYLITPIYMGVPRVKVEEMLLPVFLPFNLFKAGLNTAFTLIIYKPLINILRKSHILPPAADTVAVKKQNIIIIYVFAAFLIGTCVAVFYFINR